MQVNPLNANFIHSAARPGQPANADIHEIRQQNHFGNYIKEALNKINQLQQESDKMTFKLAAGEKVDLHEVMIAGQKASISMQAALAVRNKAIEAYQEIMRMQV
jgi:flagellar hook-basal body complex protein FliE